MPPTHLEVETKYEAAADYQLPDLAELVGTTSDDELRFADGDPVRHRLRATYFDTAELDLAAARLTLRRRTGGEDAGWHLKVPAADGARSEIRLPLGRGATTVPPRLVAMTYAITLGRPLVPVVRLETDRLVRHVTDATGRVLAEIADDCVTAQRLLLAGGSDDSDGTGELPAPLAWREVEVELVDGPPALLVALDPGLRASGLTPAASSSKLARALGPRPTTSSSGDKGGKAKAARTAPSRKKARAGDVALAHVRAQVDQIRSQDLPVRLDAPDAVHAMRVASRRLRSALTTFGPLLDREVTRPIGAELRWLAGVLGAARDAEVMRGRVTSAVEVEAPEARLDDAAPCEVGAALDGAYRAAHDDVLAQLDSPRYRALLDALHSLTEQPPLTARARRRARKELPRLVASSDSKVRSAMTAARKSDDATEREELLHTARKAAKRARYAAESVEPVAGKDARRYAAAMEGLQEALGDHLDALNTRDLLRDLASRTERPGTAFTYGRLHALEEVRAARSGALADDAWAAVRTKRVRAWLR